MNNFVHNRPASIFVNDRYKDYSKNFLERDFCKENNITTTRFAGETRHDIRWATPVLHKPLNLHF
jgi:hypothetical protein